MSGCMMFMLRGICMTGMSLCSSASPHITNISAPKHARSRAHQMLRALIRITHMQLLCLSTYLKLMGS